MTNPCDWVGDDLFQAVNRPLCDLPTLLDHLMRAFAGRAQLVSATLCVRHAGSLVLGRSGREITCDWLNDISPGAPTPGLEVAAPAAPAASVDDAVSRAQWRSSPDHSADQPKRRSDPMLSMAEPITYAEMSLGDIRISLRCDVRHRPAASQALADFARHCGLLIKRHEAQVWAAQRLGQASLLVGMSPPVRALDAFVEKASASQLPVLITGEFGTEKAQLAAMIHGCGPRRNGPFIQVNGAEPSGDPAQWFDQAQGGTLFVSGIDDLAAPLQRQLPEFMTSRLGQWLGAPVQDLRVIASTTASLSKRVVEGRFSRDLLAELDFLSVTVPPLRERRSDMGVLVATALEHNGFRAADKATGALMSACHVYAWPENTAELERVIARLAVMTGARSISDADLHLYAPTLMMTAAQPVSRALPNDGVNDGVATTSRPAVAISDRWVRCAVTRDAADLKTLHDGLRRALLYLGERYADPISLDQLAKHCNVSTSHLSFLFRSCLDSSFKTLLTGIRVQQAKEILSQNLRLPVTEVALNVGFYDLSHFEKSFRRIVGSSPRDFRRSRREPEGDMVVRDVYRLAPTRHRAPLHAETV